MSYILEAIRKSEQEREHGSVPHLHSVHSFSDTNVKKKYFPWWRVIVVALLVNAGLLAWFMKPNFSDEKQSISTQLESVEKKELDKLKQISPETRINKPDAVKQTKSAEVARPVSPITAVLPTIKSMASVDNNIPIEASTELEQDAKVIIGSETSGNLGGVIVSKATSDQTEQLKSSNKKELDVVSSDEINVPISKSPSNLVGVTVSKATSDQPKQLKSDDKQLDVDSPNEKNSPISKEVSNTEPINNAVVEPEIIKDNIVTAPVVSQVVEQEAQLPVTVKITKKKAVKIDLTKDKDVKKGIVTTEKPVLHLVDLPDSVKKSVPNLKYSGHVYSSIPSHRKVIINGNDIREGDLIANDLLLEEITPGGAILQFKEHRFRIDLLKDWSFN